MCEKCRALEDYMREKAKRKARFARCETRVFRDQFKREFEDFRVRHFMPEQRLDWLRQEGGL